MQERENKRNETMEFQQLFESRIVLYAPYEVPDINLAYYSGAYDAQNGLWTKNSSMFYLGSFKSVPNYVFDEGDKVEDKYAQDYLRSMISIIDTSFKRDAFKRNAYLAGVEIKVSSGPMAQVILCGISLNLIKGFITFLDGKNLKTSEDEINLSVMVPVLTRTNVGVLESRVSQLMERVISGSYVKGSKKDQLTYENQELAYGYFANTIQGRMRDACNLYILLRKDNVIIPGDGYGYFTGYFRSLGLQVVSGDKSPVMVGIAGELGVSLVREDWLGTLNRSRSMNIDGIVLVSFLQASCPDLIDYLISNKYRFLVYDNHAEVVSNPKLNVLNPVLRSYGLPQISTLCDMSECVKKIKVKKPMIDLVTEIIEVDTTYALDQLKPISNVYPNQILISNESKMGKSDISAILKNYPLMKLVPEKATFGMWRYPHHYKYYGVDVDLWDNLSLKNINRYLLGDVRKRDLSEYFNPVKILRKWEYIGLLDETYVRGFKRKFKKGSKVYMSLEARVYPVFRSEKQIMPFPIIHQASLQLVHLDKLGEYRYLVYYMGKSKVNLFTFKVE